MNLADVCKRQYGAPKPYDAGSLADVADTKMGGQLGEFLTDPANVIRMETATFLEQPAVEPLAPFLLDRFSTVVRGDRWKQLVGHMVRQVLEPRGYRLDAQGVWIRRGDLFTSGRRYVLA
jgi:hypothetical protein